MYAQLTFLGLYVAKIKINNHGSSPTAGIQVHRAIAPKVGTLMASAFYN